MPSAPPQQLAYSTLQVAHSPPPASFSVQAPVVSRSPSPHNTIMIPVSPPTTVLVAPAPPPTMELVAPPITIVKQVPVVLVVKRAACVRQAEYVHFPQHLQREQTVFAD
mmetsp:Transcript_26352/g.63975  ORF Transcript_26352/g.63975 Transcript_26352/m.63975 type:complete len:109 (-) Transcript_26352:177-503(-)